MGLSFALLVLRSFYKKYKVRSARTSLAALTWDHKHKMEKLYPYEFESASQLIEDFWKAVDEMLK
jgi:hypothetical protein